MNTPASLAAPAFARRLRRPVGSRGKDGAYSSRAGWRARARRRSIDAVALGDPSRLVEQPDSDHQPLATSDEPPAATRPETTSLRRGLRP